MKQVTIDELRDFAYVLSTSFLFHVLLIIIFLDILTGYAKAIKTKSLNSKIGTNGIIRHIKDIIEAIPEWIQGQEYQRNTYVRFNGVVYKTIHPIGFYEIGTPAERTDLYTRVGQKDADTGLVEITPDSSHANPYPKGFIGQYEGRVYESNYDNNFNTPYPGVQAPDWWTDLGTIDEYLASIGG